MNEKPENPDRDAGLNPELRQRTERIHDTEHPSQPPAESASVQHEEGRAWPMTWLIVTIICVVIGLWLIFF